LISARNEPNGWTQFQIAQVRSRLIQAWTDPMRCYADLKTLGGADHWFWGRLMTFELRQLPSQQL
jgi:hypothetical protein